MPIPYENYAGENYKKYLHTPHWYRLNLKLIDSNPDAKCWICGTLSKLLIHHVSYANLFKERLYRDVFILCFDCHTQVHFWLFGKVKVPLKRWWLEFSMFTRKILFCIQSRQFIPFLYFFTAWLILLFYRLTVIFTEFLLDVLFWSVRNSLSATMYLLKN